MGTVKTTYVEPLVKMNILRPESKVVEGCTGSIGWEASLNVAEKLGRNAEYYMVEKNPDQSRYHHRAFKCNYNPEPAVRDRFTDLFIEAARREGANIDLAQIRKKSGLPKFEWVVGFVEDQAALIKDCDVLLFHNHVPTSIHDRSWNGEDKVNKWGGNGQRMFFEKIIDAGPKNIAIYLPDFKEPEIIVKVLESLKARCEIVGNIDYAGKLGAFMYDISDTAVPKEEQALTGKAIICMLRS